MYINIIITAFLHNSDWSDWDASVSVSLTISDFKGQVQGWDWFLTQFLLKLAENDDVGGVVIWVLEMHENGHFLLFQKLQHDTKIMCTYAHYVTLGSCCKIASSNSEDKADTWPKRPTRIQPYQFQPVRQDFERVPEHRVSFDMRYSMGFAKLHSLKCSLHKWAWCGAARKSARLNRINLIHFRLCGSIARELVCELLQFAATQ